MRRKQAELVIALHRVQTELMECTENALPTYAHCLAGQMIALRFALGFSAQENRIAHIEILRRSPYFRKRMDMLNLPESAEKIIEKILSTAPRSKTIKKICRGKCNK